jgi:hypothetical protein
VKFTLDLTKPEAIRIGLFCVHQAVAYGQEQLDPDKSKQDKVEAKLKADRWNQIGGQFKEAAK